MKQSTLLMSAFLSVLSLSACDREKTVVTNPPSPPVVATTGPSPAPPPVTVQVPTPVPVPGPPGPQGEPGKPGAPGDTHVIVTQPAASEPK